MAIQTVTIGSMATVHQYDDGGIDAGVRCSAPIASAAPVNADECLRLGDLPTIANLITSTNVIADHAAVRGDGGARIVLELSPAEALMYHAWLMRKVDIYQRPLRLTLEPKGADSDW